MGSLPLLSSASIDRAATPEALIKKRNLIVTTPVAPLPESAEQKTLVLYACVS